MSKGPKRTEEPAEPLVVSEEIQPCGCLHTKYSNGKTGIRACPVCGLKAAAQGFINMAQAFAQAVESVETAAMALASVAAHLEAERKEQILSHINATVNRQQGGK